MSHLTNFKLAALKAAVVLVPSYTAAFLTDKMVWVEPTLAASGFFAANIKIAEDVTTRRVDEDGDSADLDAEDVTSESAEFSGS